MKKLLKYLQNEQGVIPLLLIIAGVGLIGFLAISSTFSFKNNIFNNLFPKPTSHAISGPIPTPTSTTVPDTNPQLLLAANFTDSSTSNHVMSSYGNAKLVPVPSSASPSAFRSSPAVEVLDGSGDYLTTPDSLDFNLEGDFTIDTWVYLNAAPAAGFGAALFSKDDGLAVFDPLSVVLDPQLNLRIWASSNCSSWDVLTADPGRPTFADLSHALTLGSWHHFALTRSGSSWRVFVDGVQQGSTVEKAGPLCTNTRSVYLFGQFQSATGSGGINGYIDHYRVTKGVARWTANFTPPITY